MDIRALHREAVDTFTAHLEGASPDRWGSPTPCGEWDVRQLVNHVVGEQRWIPPLLGGSTVAEVGDALDGDLLGDDPIAAWRAAIGPAQDAVEATPLDQVVHLSFADVPAEEYLRQLTADYVIHAWDLAHATGQAESIPADVVEPIATWFETAEDLYRAAGAIGPRVDVTSPDPFAVLLGRFGRDPSQPMRTG